MSTKNILIFCAFAFILLSFVENDSKKPTPTQKIEYCHVSELYRRGKWQVFIFESSTKQRDYIKESGTNPKKYMFTDMYNFMGAQGWQFVERRAGYGTTGSLHIFQRIVKE